jgi:SNF2 family DNA or RNA helicase
MTSIPRNTSLVFSGIPYNHQRDIVERRWREKYWGFLFEPGTGKSYTVIMNFANLYLIGEIDAVLYVAKKGEYANFATYQIPEHMPGNVRYKSWIYTGYASSRHVAVIKEALAPRPELRILSVNCEAIRHGKAFEVAKAFLRSSRRAMIIADESTFLKDHRSAQHKAMMQLRPYAYYARIMTGTLITRTPVDIFNQSRFLDKYAMGYSGVTSFKVEFEEVETTFLGKRKFDKVIGIQNAEELRRRIRTFADVIRKEDCLDLPDKIYKKYAVPLTKEQVRLYEDFVNFAVAEIEGELVEAVNALSVMSKLHQILCGQVRMPNGSYSRVKNHRIKITAELIADILDQEQKVVLWSHFRESTNALHEYLVEVGYDVVRMPAGMKTEDRMERLNRFKTDDKAQIFLANPASSGFGITLTEARSTIYFSNSDNFEHRLQSEDRTHRIGQKLSCIYYDIHSPGTVEDAILERTKIKSEMRDLMMPKDEFLGLIKLGDYLLE